MKHPDTLSFWERESFLNNIDVLIIGSGIVGLSTALSLKEQKTDLRIVVAERGPLPEGASTRNAGFACFGSASELLDDLKHTSEDEMLALVERRWRGLQKLRARLGDAAIQYEGLGGYELFLPSDAEVLERCCDHLSHFNKLLAPIIGEREVYRLTDHNFGFRGVSRTIHNVAEGQIHTGSTMRALLRKAAETDIQIMNGMNITHIEDVGRKAVLSVSEGWSFEADKVVVCTNGFARRLLPHLEVKPARNQVLVTKPIENLPWRGCFHYDRGYYYFRNIGDDRILLGGGRILDLEREFTDDFGTTDTITSALTALLRDVILPGREVEVDMWWSGIMGLGEVKKPIVQHISGNVVVAVRMGGMGVAIGSLVGVEAANVLLES